MLSGYKTLIGAGVALLAEVLRLNDVEVDVAGVTNSVLVIGGLAVAIFGRLVAKTPGPLAKE